MKRITISNEIMNHVWEHWMRTRINSDSLTAMQYHIDAGWDLKYHPDSLSYTIPEDQIAFFLLSL